MNIFFIILFYFNLAQACEISVNESYLKLGENFYPSLDQIKSQNCNLEKIEQFKQNIMPLEGEIPTEYLSDNLMLENVKLNTLYVTIYNLEPLFLIGTSSEMAFKNIVFNSKNINLDKFKLERVECNNCHIHGRKTFKVIIKKDDLPLELWVSGLFQKKIDVLKAKENIYDTEVSLDSSLFERVKIYTEEPDVYFNDLEKIKFFRPSTRIAKDLLLKNDQVVKNYLIKQGSAVEVVLKNDKISISSRGQAMSNGKYGEMVKVKTVNKKEISGLIKDFNQVEIQL